MNAMVKQLGVCASVLLLAISCRLSPEVRSVPQSAAAENEIRVGMTLATLTQRLEAAGLEVDSKYGLSIRSRDPKTRLQFSRLDDDITLVISYDRVSKEVTKLSLYMIPDNRTSKLQMVVRSASSIKVLDTGEFVFRVSPVNKRGVGRSS